MPITHLGAATRGRPAVHLALPLGLVGFTGSWFVCDFFRFGFTGAEESARGMLTFTLPFAGALMGLVLSSKAVSKRRWRTCLAVLGATLFAGATVGAALGSGVWSRGEPGENVWTGLATSLVFLPFVGLITWLARNAARARPGSIVYEADRRAPWAVIAAAVTIGRLLTCMSPFDPLSIHAHDQLHSVCSALAWLASCGLTLLTACDLVGLKQAQRAYRDILDMLPRDARDGLPCDNTVDVGLGDSEHEEVAGGPAYRTMARPIRVIRGSPDEALRALSGSVCLTAGCTVIAWFATLAPIASQH